MAEEYGNQELEIPPEEEPSEEEAEVRFEAEPERPAAAMRSLSFEAEAAPEAALTEEASEAITSVFQAVSAALEAQVEAEGIEAFAEPEDRLEGAGNVVGVGMGYVDEQPGQPSAEPAAPAINLYVVEAMSEERARRVLAEQMGAEAAQDEQVPMNVFVTGEIEAQPHRFRIRPAPGGVSVGHVRITAGTLGCLARGRSGDRTRRRLILSNNHVLANSNAARFGDSIVQPGPADGGVSPADRIAILERFVPLDFSGAANLVDCATGWAWPDRVQVGQVFVRNGLRRIFRTGATPIPCQRELLVGKSGRTTQLTQGRIVDCNATIRVRYGARTALFRDQISIRGLSTLFSSSGDSGSLIWSWDPSRAPVGLLFAGGESFTFANKIQHVLDALDIRLET
jgi:hypothetical protein